MTPPVSSDDPGTVRIIAADGSFSPTPAAEPYLALDRRPRGRRPRGLLPRHGRHPRVRRAGDQPAAAGSAGAVAAELRAGGRAGRLGARRPPAGPPLPVLPRARGGAHPRRRPHRHHPRHARAHARRLEPVRSEERQRPHLHARARLADPARDGARRWAWSFDGRCGTGDPERDEAVIVYYGDGASSQGDVHEAMVFAASYRTPEVFFLQNNQWAISVPVATQSPLAAAQARRGLRDAVDPGRRQRRAGELGRDPRRARRGARRTRPARDRGDDLPDGRAHDERRPDEVPHLRRGGVVAAPRSDRPHEGVPAGPGRVGGVLRRRGCRVRRRGGGHPRPHRRARRPRAARRCSRTSTPNRTRSSTSSAAGSPTTRHPSREGPHDRRRRRDRADRDHDAVQPRAERRAPRGARRQRPGAAHGRGHRPARRRLPRDGGAAGRVRRPPRARHPARRVGHRRARRSGSRWRGSVRCARSSSTDSSSPRSTRSRRSSRSRPSGTRARSSFPS